MRACLAVTTAGVVYESGRAGLNRTTLSGAGASVSGDFQILGKQLVCLRNAGNGGQGAEDDGELHANKSKNDSAWKAFLNVQMKIVTVKGRREAGQTKVIYISKIVVSTGNDTNEEVTVTAWLIVRLRMWNSASFCLCASRTGSDAPYTRTACLFVSSHSALMRHHANESSWNQRAYDFLSYLDSVSCASLGSGTVRVAHALYCVHHGSIS